jgi:hypothetical protein
MYYNQFTNQWSEVPMPLLMGFTHPEPIREAENISVTYDPVFQIIYDMRTIGTRCLKYGVTKKKRPSGASVTDNANEIDDSKSVK